MRITREIDCLIVRQPYASLIAYGSKRWEFRTYNCEKRGLICIGSSRAPPLKTGDSYLNSVSNSFPRGYALATGVLSDSFIATNKHLRKVYNGVETVTIHGYKIRTASKPLGEPVEDILKSINDKKWKMFAWVLRDVSSLNTLIELQNRNGGSTWTKVELADEEPLSKTLESYL
jgi:hypothetical protein